MLFNSLEYACLLLASIAGCWFFTDKHKIRISLLLAASYLFYASWNYKYLILIFFSSSMDYLLGGQIAKSTQSSTRKLLLFISVAANLGILSIFKYFNFFATEFCDALGLFGISFTPWYLDVLLPVGISFYTFQSLSYTIDVYRGDASPAKSYLQYLLFVSFFPQLVAGPIVRARNLLPKLLKKPTLTAEQGSNALYRIGIGLIKKMAIADYLGAQIVDPVFSNPGMYSSVETLVGVWAYAFQIYCDFSAYSDIAIGSASLLGIELPENFLAPYRSANLRQFWQRWHISLSTWLRDYLYIPLGGSRCHPARTYSNLLITMLLGGLWHGASTTFVIWGALHGLALAVTRLFERTAQPVQGANKETTPATKKTKKVVSIVITFQFVSFAWVFFRAPDLAGALAVFSSITEGSFGAANIPALALLALAAALISHYLPESTKHFFESSFIKLPSFAQAAVVVSIILFLQVVARSQVQPFIYFQF